MLAFKPHRQPGARTARMEQRITPETKALIEHAACLQGVNASEFLIAHGVQAAVDTIRKLEGTVLTAEDREAFMHAFDAVEPTPALEDLMAMHAEATLKK